MTIEPLTEDARIVLAFVRSHPGLHPYYIARELGISIGRVDDALKELLRGHLVEKRFEKTRAIDEDGNAIKHPLRIHGHVTYHAN